MSENDFFGNLDKQIQSQRQASDADEKEKITRATCEFIRRVTPMLERYKAELEKRGFCVTLHGSPSISGNDYLVFALHFNKGGRQGFEIHRGKLSRIFFHDGQEYHTGVGDISGITEETFETHLQKIIEEFLSQAERDNRGWRKE